MIKEIQSGKNEARGESLQKKVEELENEKAKIER